MLADALFTAIATLLHDAQTQVGKLRTAEQNMLAKASGAKEIRATEYLNTEIIMDSVLNKVQEAGDADLPNAGKIFSSHQLKIVERSAVQRDELEVKNGKKSGTFDVRNRKVANYISFVWLISTDKKLWHLGAFGNAASATIDSINEQPLELGTKYYIKTCNRTSKGVSDFSQIVEMFCV